MSIFVGEAFNRSWGVTLYRFAKQDGWRERFARVAAYLLFALYLTGLAIAIAAPELFSLMVPQSFYPPYLLLPLLIAAYLFRETGDFFRSLLLINKRAKTVGSVAFAGAVLNTVLNFSLIPTFGIFGAAFATLGTWAAYMIVCWVVAWREHRVPVSVLAFAKLNFLAILVFGVGDWLRLDRPLLQAILDLCWVALFAVLCLTLYFSPTERKQLVSAIENRVWWLISARPKPYSSPGAGLPTVIMIAYYYPPENAIGAARPYRFTKYLSRLGFPISVVSRWIPAPAINSTTAASQNAGKPAEDRQMIVDPPTSKLPAKVTEFRVQSPQDARGLKHYMSELLHLLTRYFLPYNDRLPWLPYAYSASSAVLAANPNHVLFSTHPPAATLLVALALKLRHGSRWIADFRDPLAKSPARTSRRAIMLDAIVERLVFRHADIVIANTDAVKQIWEDRYPQWRQKIHLIWNGFDQEDPIIPRPIPVRDRRIIAHTGTIYGGRTPRPLIEALDRLIVSEKILPTAVQLRLLGPIENNGLDTDSAAFQRLMALGCLNVDNRMAPQPEAREEMLNADYLLLLDIVGNEIPSIQFPAKTFDYIRACRPILAFTPNDSVIKRVLATVGIPCTCIEPTAPEAEVDIAVLAFLTQPQVEVEPSVAFWHNFDAANQTFILANLISRISAPTKTP